MKKEYAIAVRRASAADADSMSLIHKRAWVKAYKGLIEQSYLDGLKDDRWVQLFEKGFSEGTMTAWMASLNGVPAACACVSASRYAGTEDALELQSIYCLSEHWGKGVGHALMRRVKEYAAANGHPRIALWVLEGNDRAVRFYETEGFSDTGERTGVTIAGRQSTEKRYIFAGYDSLPQTEYAEP